MKEGKTKKDLKKELLEGKITFHLDLSKAKKMLFEKLLRRDWNDEKKLSLTHF